jgi:hypothetical protein
MTQEQVFGIVRHAMTAIGGIFVFKGLLDESMLQELIGAALGLGGVIWSIVSKKK